MLASREIGGVRVHCVALYVVVVLAIILYGWFIRRNRLRDPLARQIYFHPLCQDLDGWSATHLLFFATLGVLFPGKYLQFLVVGVGWEVIETILGQNELKVSGHRLQLMGDQDEDGNPTGKQDAYWYGRCSDILVDVVGYTLGSTWAEKYWPAAACSSGRGAVRAGPGTSGRPEGVLYPSWV